MRQLAVNHWTAGSQDFDPWEKRVTWGKTCICPGFLLEPVPCCGTRRGSLSERGGLASSGLLLNGLECVWLGPKRKELQEGNPEAGMCVHAGWDPAESSCSPAGKRMAIARVMQGREKRRVLAWPGCGETSQSTFAIPETPGRPHFRIKGYTPGLRT